MASSLKMEGTDSSAPLSNASGSLKTKNNWTSLSQNNFLKNLAKNLNGFQRSGLTS